MRGVYKASAKTTEMLCELKSEIKYLYIFFKKIFILSQKVKIRKHFIPRSSYIVIIKLNIDVVSLFGL
jgi:hypothetical protein